MAAFIALALLFDVSGAVLHDDLYSSAVVLFYCGQLSVLLLLLPLLFLLLFLLLLWFMMWLLLLWL